MRVLSENSTLVIDKMNEAPTKLPFCELFPTDLQLEWNTEGRILSLLSIREPRILAQQQFTRNEWLLLMSLMLFCLILTTQDVFGIIREELIEAGLNRHIRNYLNFKSNSNNSVIMLALSILCNV